MITRIRAALLSFCEKIENDTIPILSYCLLLFSAITLRNFLEIFSDVCPIPFKLTAYFNPSYIPNSIAHAVNYIHYAVFWVILFLAASLALAAVTKTRPLAAFRALCAFSLIIVITPVFDLIISGGKGFNITYPYPRSPLDFFPIPSNFTPGMIATASIGMLLAGIYSWIKTNSLTKAALGICAMYAVLACVSLIPFAFNIRNALPLIKAALIILWIELLLIFWKTQPIYAEAVIRDTRILRTLYFYILIILGMALRPAPLLQTILTHSFDCILLSIACLCAWVTTVIFNNIEDLSIDRVTNTARPLVSGAIPLTHYRAIGIIALCLSILYSIAVNFQTFFILSITLACSYAYSLPPLKIKRVPVFSKLCTSTSSLALIMIGYTFAGGELLSFPHRISLFFLVCVTLIANFIDLKDYAGDKQAGIPTLPVLLGMRKAQYCIATIALASYACLGLILQNSLLLLPGISIGIIAFWLITKKNYRDAPVLVVHLAAIIIMCLAVRAQPACADGSCRVISALQKKPAVKTLNNANLDTSIQRGLAFLSSHQKWDGSFATCLSTDRDMPGFCRNKRSPYITTFIIHALSFLDDARVQRITKKATLFLSKIQLSNGLWKFSTDAGARMPPDVDDTACSAALLESAQAPHIDPKPVLLANRNAAGLVYTWVGPAPKNNDIDCAVNANVLWYLGMTEHTAGICAYLRETIQTKTEQNQLFYCDTMQLYYVISRAYAHGATCLEPIKPALIARIMAQQKHTGSFGNELETALAVSSLCNLNYYTTRIDNAVRYLINTQHKNGSWQRYTAFFDRTPYFYGSQELTTGLCIEAITRYRLLTKLTRQSFPKTEKLRLSEKDAACVVADRLNP